MLRRAARLNPLFYSFLAGTLAALACNVYTAAAFGTSLPLALWQVYSSAAALAVCAFLVFLVSTQLEELRTLQATMKTPPDPNDLDLLLAQPARYWRLLLLLVAAGLTFFLSALLLSTQLGSMRLSPLPVTGKPCPSDQIQSRSATKNTPSSTSELLGTPRPSPVPSKSLPQNAPSPIGEPSPTTPPTGQ